MFIVVLILDQCINICALRHVLFQDLQRVNVAFMNFNILFVILIFGVICLEFFLLSQVLSSISSNIFWQCSAFAARFKIRKSVTDKTFKFPDVVGYLPSIAILCCVGNLTLNTDQSVRLDVQLTYNNLIFKPLTGATLSTVEGQESLPRPEEERITQAEKNKKMQDQLKVRKILTFTSGFV